MDDLFPEPIRKLPQADIPLDGITAFLAQSETHQIIFMRFDKDVELPEHQHEAQVGYVLDGAIELLIDGKHGRYTRGDRYYIPAGVPHSGRIFAGYADITVFDEAARYSIK